MSGALPDTFLFANAAIALIAVLMVLRTVATFLDHEFDIQDLVVETNRLRAEYQRRIDEIRAKRDAELDEEPVMIVGEAGDPVADDDRRAAA